MKNNNWLVHVLFAVAFLIGIILLFTLPTSKAADFNKMEPICEAQIIFDYKSKIKYYEALEMIRTAEEIGQIDVNYANELREIVQKVYKLTGKDLENYVKSKCQKKKN